MNLLLKSRRDTALVIILLTLWMIGGYPLLKAEITTYKLLPEILRMGPQQRANLVGGPIYSLSQESRTLIPRDSTIAFLSPPKVRDVYTGRLRYYLYPSKIIPVIATDKEKMIKMKESDYILSFYPKNIPNPMDALIESENIKVYDHVDQSGHQSIFKVRK
jgi:hypothetical protein